MSDKYLNREKLRQILHVLGTVLIFILIRSAYFFIARNIYVSYLLHFSILAITIIISPIIAVKLTDALFHRLF